MPCATALPLFHRSGHLSKAASGDERVALTVLADSVRLELYYSPSLVTASCDVADF